MFFVLKSWISVFMKTQDSENFHLKPGPLPGFALNGEWADSGDPRPVYRVTFLTSSDLGHVKIIDDNPYSLCYHLKYDRDHQANKANTTNKAGGRQDTPGVKYT